MLTFLIRNSHKRLNLLISVTLKVSGYFLRVPCWFQYRVLANSSLHSQLPAITENLEAQSNFLPWCWAMLLSACRLTLDSWKMLFLNANFWKAELTMHVYLPGQVSVTWQWFLAPQESLQQFRMLVDICTCWSCCQRWGAMLAFYLDEQLLVTFTR